jgi:hypothetical protein
MRHGANYPSCIHDCIHPLPKKMKKKLLLRCKVSHMEIDCKEKKAPKMIEH